jgi:uncharacterized membrane protein
MNENRCVSCQAQLDSDAVFCNECGAVQAAAVTSPRVPVETQTAVYKTCPQCQKQLVESVKFCSGCAYDFSLPELKAPPPEWLSESAPSLETAPSFSSDSNGAKEFSPELRLALRKRYRDGYRVANTITGFGALLKALGVVIGLIIGFTGFVAGTAMEQAARQSMFGGGGGAGIVLMVILGIVGFLVAAIFWILGVIISANGQMLKTHLDSAVNSSPFLADMERAEIMSLPTGTGEKKTFEMNRAYKKSGNIMLPNLRASLAYGGSFILGILWIPVPIYFLATVPVEQRLVRFHSFQSIILMVIFFISGLFLTFSSQIVFGSNILGALSVVIWLVSIGINFICLWKAYNNEEFKIPIVGDLAMNFVQKSESNSVAY